MKFLKSAKTLNLQYLFSTLLLILLSSCEQRPVERRALPGPTLTLDNDKNKNTEHPSSTEENESGQPNSEENKNPSSDNSSDEEKVSLPPQFSHCRFSQTYFDYHHATTGKFNICLEKGSSPKKIKFQIQKNESTYRLCFFPTAPSPRGGSIYIGEAKCLFPKALQIEEISFKINRNGFTDKIMTGVMIIQDRPYGEVTPYHMDLFSNPPTYADAYVDCMEYLSRTGDAFACERFKTKQNYVQVQFASTNASNTSSL